MPFGMLNNADIILQCIQPLGDDHDAAVFVARIEAFSASLGVQLAALRTGRDAGRVANRTSVLDRPRPE